MPFFGEMDVDAAIAAAPLLDIDRTEPWLLPRAQYVQVSYEAEHAGSMRLTPPSLHPAVPPYVTISALHCPESPMGAFTLAQVRLAVRAGIRPRALLLAAFCSSSDVAEELARGWGWTVRAADVHFSARHDSVRARVAVDGRTILEFEGAEYEPVGPGDVTLLDNLHLVRLLDADPDAPSAAIVQIDPIFQIISVDRGRPVLRTFDADACGGRGNLRITAPVAAVTCVADVELPRPRFAMDTRVPALQSSRKLGQATPSPR